MQLRGKGDNALNNKDVFVRCQQQELYQPGGSSAILAGRPTGDLKAPGWDSAETSDLHYAASALKNKVTQTP